MAIGRMRRWRPLLFIALFWVFVFYYLFADDELSTSTNRSSPQQLSKTGSKGMPTRWAKLPERYPVKKLKTIPSIDSSVKIPKIQATPDSESPEAFKIRQRRLQTVKDTLAHSWKGYTKHAWLKDEVTPLSGRQKDTFGGWGATLVDSLDTLWIMGLKDEFHKAAKAAESIDFGTSGTVDINVFETIIRYLGGFLAAYEISEKKYPGLLEKAVEVADLIMCAFDTPNRFPITRWGWAEYTKGSYLLSKPWLLQQETGNFRK